MGVQGGAISPIRMNRSKHPTRGIGSPGASGGVAEWFRQGPAKPRTAVRFRPPPPTAGTPRVPSPGVPVSRWIPGMSQPVPNPAPALHLHGWRDRAILGVALAALASGVGQFGVVAALGDVARTFGQVTHGASLTDQAGLSGTELGIGLAIIRLSSIGALPLTGLADRVGRRRMLLVTVIVGLAVTVIAAASPGYWWFVAVFALGRPFLSATNALSQVVAAAQTGSGQRARAVALVTAGYGVGAGLTAVIHSLASSALGFRGVFALAVVPLAVVPLVARWVTESDRYAVATAARSRPMPVIGAVGLRFRTRLLVLVGLSFMVALVTGPANTFIFLYAQNVRHLAGGFTAAMVVGAGLFGLGGLLIGRWLADHLGRRPTTMA